MCSEGIEPGTMADVNEMLDELRQWRTELKNNTLILMIDTFEDIIISAIVKED